MKSVTDVIGGKQGLFEGFHSIQSYFEEHLSGEHKNFIHLLQVIESCSPLLIHTYKGVGRRSYEYTNFFRAFFAQFHFGIPTVKMLIETLRSDPNMRQLCGFGKIPSASTFSRRLNDLSCADIMDGILDTLVRKAYGDLPIIHICRDSTAIESREKAHKKNEKPEKACKKRGRPAKGTRQPEKEPTILQQQAVMDVKDSIRMLNRTCSWNCKKNSRGKMTAWKGYKLHLDVSDIGFPISVLITGANVHDSQAAIPLEKMTMGKVCHLYSVMDAAYDAGEIKEFIKRCRRIPVIDPNPRNNKNYIPLDPAKRERYKIRTVVERAYSHLKDNLFPRNIYVKGFVKISFVLMIGILCLAAQKYIHYFSPALQ